MLSKNRAARINYYLLKDKHNFMKRKCWLFSTLMVCSGLAFAQPFKDSLDARMQQLGKQLLNEKGGVGLSAGIYHNGQVYYYNFGATQAGTTKTPSSQTMYEIGSVTKTFESYILANAVIEGRVKPGDDIRKYLKGSYPGLEYNGKGIQLIHLATTTSLLPDWLPELPAGIKALPPAEASKARADFYRHLSKQDLLNALQHVKLDTLPGSKRSHSNAGAQLLAHILEDVYQMPMDKLIKKYITKPAKMERTFFIDSSRLKYMATGYTGTGEKSGYEFNMPYFKYAGGLGSCTEDLVKYIQLLLKKTNPASVLSLKKAVDINASTGEITPLTAEGIATPEVYSAALNWFKYQPEVNVAQIWADGGTNGFNSYLVMYPYLNSGIVLLANKSDEKIFRALPGIAYELSKLLK